MKAKFYSGLCMFLSVLTVSLYSNGQSNSYFVNGESWSGEYFGVSTGTSFYVWQEGDTLINGDTLVKLKKYSGSWGWNIMPETGYYLAENENGILNMFYSVNQYSVLEDSIVIDYSRNDSITYWFSNSMYPPIYESRPITFIDTVYLNGVPKKMFGVTDYCLESDDDIVLEGVFAANNSPYFDGCFEYLNNLLCLSVHDSSYYWGGTEFYPNQVQNGPCYIPNLGIDSQPYLIYTVFPNPFTDYLRIESDLEHVGLKGSICSASGTSVIDFETDASITELCLTGLPSGIYYLTLYNQEQPRPIQLFKL